MLRRTQALLAELQATGTPQTLQRLAPLAKALAALRLKAERIDPKALDARYALYFALCQVRRDIAFANPVLDFTSVLFAKRHFMAPEVNFPLVYLMKRIPS